MPTNIKLLTTDIFDKDKYKVLGMVSGIQVKSLSILRNLFSDIATIFGTGKTDWTGITKIFEDTKKEAFDKMRKNAKDLGADEIIGVRIGISQISHGGKQDGMLVCSCEGTAVKNITNTKSVTIGGSRISTKKKSKKQKKNQKKKQKKKQTNKQTIKQTKKIQKKNKKN
jgi:uncharacterized protein YbjQ (UPF0145 family)